ncbi:MAG: hypothetical protein V4662_04505 [Verrucomicrobiota bacterium]
MTSLRPRSLTPRVGILNCATGERAVVASTPFILGSSAAADFRTQAPGCPSVLGTIQQRGDVFEITLHADAAGASLVDGAPGTQFTLQLGEEHTLVSSGEVLAFKALTDASEWSDLGIDPFWHFYDAQTRQWYGPFDHDQMGQHIRRQSAEQAEDNIAMPGGLHDVGFFVKDVRHIFPTRQAQMAQEELVQAVHSEPVNMEYGEFTCPVCWFKFDRGDAMNIAVHATLRGDPLLGEDAMQRFHATRFNDRGQALDAMGISAPDLACPHCRRKLPPGFMDTPHHIFSIVGAPSSGKSYYLSVLTRTLQTSLYQNFGVTFRDADPSENVILTQMRTQLFSASTPEDAFLAKTELEGMLYETLPRQGRKVRLPKPFVFKLTRSRAHDTDFALVFYDNAGEHFEPTRNSADSPGAQHIAVASGIFFLFDPLHNTEFRQRLRGIRDPQIQSRRLDQQDVILAETEVRIKNVLGLDSRQTIDTPFAVMIGKSDTWEHLLGDAPLLPSVEKGALLIDNVLQNSNRVRDLLLELCPAIVANAEAISSNVAYFPISPLGCSPVQFTDSEGHVRIGPDPSTIQPKQVEVPSLWVLSQLAPEVVTKK